MDEVASKSVMYVVWMPHLQIFLLLPPSQPASPWSCGPSGPSLLRSGLPNQTPSLPSRMWQFWRLSSTKRKQSFLNKLQHSFLTSSGLHLLSTLTRCWKRGWSLSTPSTATTYLPMYVPTFFRRKFQTQELWPWRLTSCSSARHCPLWTFSTTSRMTTCRWTPSLLELFLLVPARLLLLHLPVFPALQVPAVTTRNMVKRLSTARNPVWSQRTSSPAGGSSCPTFQFLWAVLRPWTRTWTGTWIRVLPFLPPFSPRYKLC